MFGLIAAGALAVGGLYWYRRETLAEGDGIVHLPSEHEHFHMHVDLPAGMQIQPGDTLEILSLPELPHGQTQGEISYPSRVRLYKASALKRYLVKKSSLVEIMVKHLHDPTLRSIFKSMSRDEGRHAGFLNRTMSDLNVALDLSMLQKRKKYSHFQPRFIFYATYLSEKIGYSRYITIYRHLEQHPEGRLHPIFKWFKDWCNDEYRHGEFFAMLMRSQPELLQGNNRRWIRFFLLAVYATMYLNDARRSSFYAAMGLNWREYDQQVLRLCNDIATQVFPDTMPLDDPRFYRNLDACVAYDQRQQELAGRTDPIAKAQTARLRAAIGLRLFATYRMPTRQVKPEERWQGLEGFPNYPGPNWRERTVAAD
jgi:magnesium-protoporphyrin IX monomethyl ester (oxidative) cyclase